MQQKNIPVVRIAERTPAQSIRLALGILILVALAGLVLHAAFQADRDMDVQNEEIRALEVRAAAVGLNLQPTSDEVGPHHKPPHRTHAIR